MLPSSPDGEARPRFLAFAQPYLEKSGIDLRPAGEGDRALVATLYATTRAEELRQVDWSDAQKRVFTDWQSQQQEAHYGLHYPAAERLLVEKGEPIGRIYVDTTSAEVRLMEVTLLPAWRNQGIGTRLTRLLLEYADRLRLPASLHVEPFNPAKRMYQRMGFGVVEVRGVYEYMLRPVPGG